MANMGTGKVLEVMMRNMFVILICGVGIYIYMLYIYTHTQNIYICIFKSILQKYEILYVNSTKLLKNNLSIKTLASYTWLKARSREITRSPDIVWISLPLQLTSLFSLLKPTFFMAKRETNSPA